MNQNDLNDLLRDLGLTEENWNFLSSRLKQSNMLQKGVNCIHFHFRHASFQEFFSVQNSVCYCSNISGLFEALESERHSNERKLFIDSGKASLKAVLLNNRNEKPSTPLLHATSRKEIHETIKLILRLITNFAYNGNNCGDLKVIDFLLDMQIGYNKLTTFSLCFQSNFSSICCFEVKSIVPLLINCVFNHKKTIRIITHFMRYNAF